MKFWQLVATCQEQPELLQRLGDSPDWVRYVEWLGRFEDIVANQERDKLDHLMPDDACRHVLSPFTIRYTVSGGHIRWAEPGTDERTYSAVEIYDTHGGAALEEVREKGSVNLRQ